MIETIQDMMEDHQRIIKEQAEEILRLKEENGQLKDALAIDDITQISRNIVEMDNISYREALWRIVELGNSEKDVNIALSVLEKPVSKIDKVEFDERHISE